MSTAHYDVHGNVAVIRLDNPPVNGLGLALRQGIVNCIRQAESDEAVKAVILIGSDRAFSGGADISEFGTDKAMTQPVLPTVINYVESSRKPVIAAPMPAPVNPDSDSGVSRMRSGPNLSSRPLETA